MSLKYARFHSKLKTFGNFWQSPFLLAVRLFWGGSFVVTGLGKFSNLGRVTEFFQSLGIPLAPLSAFMTASIETICGACLFVGFASRLVAIPLICTMIVAFATAESAAVHAIFTDPQNFIHRDPFSFLFASLIIFVFGPGALALDYWIWERKKAT